MSLIIAIKDQDRVVLGADKQVSTGVTKNHAATKIWEVKELPGALMGGVGSCRASQIIQYSQIIDMNDIPEEMTTDYVVAAIAPAIAGILKANGIRFEPRPDEDCPMMPNSFIFAYKDRAWSIWNDLSVSEIEDYFTIGSGSDVANGALFATREKNPFDRIVVSIDAAAESTLFVDDGIDLLMTEQRKKDIDQISAAIGVELRREEAVEEETIDKVAKKEKKSKKKAAKKKETKKVDNQEAAETVK